MRADSAVEPTKVGEHHRDLAALGAVFGMCAWGTRRGRCVNGGRLAARVATQSSDSIEQLAAVPERGDAKLLQVLRRQARKNRLVYLILAECRLILPEAQAPQPDHNVHDMSQSRVGGMMVAPKGGVQLGTVRPITARPVPITDQVQRKFLAVVPSRRLVSAAIQAAPLSLRRLFCLPELREEGASLLGGRAVHDPCRRYVLSQNRGPRNLIRSTAPSNNGRRGGGSWRA